MSVPKIILSILLSAICGALLTGILVRCGGFGKEKIAVVDAIRLFRVYDMKLEMEREAEGYLNGITRHVDSLKGEISGRQQARQPEAGYSALMQQYHEASAYLEQAYEQTNRDINEQVWKRLNPLIDEFGRERKLRLIIGANGMGSVLYHDAYYDLTDEVIDFVNRKYAKGN